MNRPDGPGVNLKLTSTRMLTTGERNYMLHTQKKTKPDLNKAPSKNLRQHRQKKMVRHVPPLLPTKNAKKEADERDEYTC